MIRNKKGYRRVILIFTAAALVFMIVCTILTAYHKSNPSVFLITGEEDEAFRFGLEAGIARGEAEFGITVRRLGGGDAQKQTELVDQAIREKAGILLLSPADQEALAPAVEKARSNGIRVVLTGSTLLQSNDLPRVGTDDLLAGKKAANALTAYLPEGSSIAVIGGNEGNSVTADRLEGIMTACQEGEMALAGTALGLNGREEAAEAVKRLLEEHPDLGGIIALGEELTLGAADALQQAGSKASLVGFGAAPEQAALLQAGRARALIAERPVQAGYTAVKAAVNLGKGLQVSPFTDTGSVTLTKENLGEKENQKLISEYKENE